MVVQHNMQAANANRMLNVTTSAQSKSTEKLSSGYKINRAADDAAGLTISEKMRKQIRGLDRASTNAEDGVSAVQTAEGALTEVHSMLQRMNELATQSANGTNSTTDRQAIQDEIDQLSTEIDRVSETTKFNEMYLLKGTDGTTATKTVNAHDAGLNGNLVDNGDGTSTFTANSLAVGGNVSIAGTEYTIVDSGKITDYTDLNGYTATAGDKLTKDGETYTYVGANGTSPAGQTITTAGWFKDSNDTTTADAVTIAAGDKLTKAGKTTTLVGDTAAATTIKTLKDAQTAIKAAAANSKVTIGGTEYTVSTKTDLKAADPTATADDLAKMVTADSSIKIGTTQYYVVPKASDKETDITLDDAYKKMAKELETASSIGTDVNSKASVTNNGDGTFTITKGKVNVKDALSFNLHVGADADTTNKISVNIDSMSSAGLGIKGIKADTEQNATYAIDAIADAISTVSSQRSSLGAVQNRLEHTINNLDNVVENTTSAESRIRDTDMAEEMVNYSKNNILAQAGQSMLAQANQSNQGVLSLLQ